ncbi:hypothetical protein DPMN_112197 [Dreissena polymorpha]|uniref:Homeobox domain-containing protein n=1 Tax=Dreissena polymorpha TaxID=45954 RepID=A0A9D4KGC8_DREPO|nr:hypothetical protein DPMN_112197 [Dreissena polymorpha]
MACTYTTNAFPQLNSSANTSGLRFHPYLCKTNYPRGPSSEGRGVSESGNYYHPNMCANAGTYQQKLQTRADAWYSTRSTPRESHGDLSRYLAADITHLSMLKTLQEVCGLGNANVCLTNAVWSPEHSISRTNNYEMKSEIKGENFDHPFYNRRRRAAVPEEGMTRTRDKYRVVYTDRQRKGLEQAYEENKFITMEIRSKLSKELDLSDRQVNNIIEQLIKLNNFKLYYNVNFLSKV